MTITTSISTVNPILPSNLIEKVIIPNLSLPELGACSRVCKAWKEMAKKQINGFSHEKAFGPKEWHTYFGAHLRNIPRLSPNITEILNSPCPFWPDKQVHETHLLVLVPGTLSAQPLTFKTLVELVKKPSQGHAPKYDYFSVREYTDLPAPVSCWVLMTRDVIEGSRNQCYQDQKTLLIQKGQGAYVVPTLLDAAVCIFMEYVRSGKRLYGDSPYTFTSCQEKYSAIWPLAVGGFGSDGLRVARYGSNCESNGVGGCRKFNAIGH